MLRLFSQLHPHRFQWHAVGTQQVKGRGIWALFPSCVLHERVPLVWRCAQQLPSVEACAVEARRNLCWVLSR